ncbi:discoidin domain-containing protein [Pseudomonas sp. Q1-7]|uniref:discoidin domain-containing protein n=1 Tax=Pseudomonas sp. Q1-7 TaxID=3020843 RepID=UPI0023014A0F|nr:discoidin domain-containing protein [Pseudomonas sp. Q1-7]
MPNFRLHELSRGTRLWLATLGVSVLLPQAGSAIAHVPVATAEPNPQQTTLSGHFIDLAALASPRARGFETPGSERLMREAGVSVRSLASVAQEGYKGIRVMTGKLDSRTGQATGDIVMALREDGSFVALMPERNGMIRGNAQGEQFLTLFPEDAGYSQERPDAVDDPGEELSGLIQSRSGALHQQADRNAEGELLIDILAGFSEQSAKDIEDHEAYALAQVASVNQALKNSQIEGVRLRLVGTQVIADDYVIDTTTLGNLKNLFAEGMRQYSPDLVTAFFVGKGSQDTAVGWAYTNGRYSLNALRSVTAFRHELGHNIGGSHCPTGKGYNFGFNNGRVATIMCGNSFGYYSNPELTDNQGIPIGDAEKANMARVWRNNAAKISAYSPSVVPIDDEQVSPLIHERFDLTRQTDGWRHFTLDLPEGMQRLAFSVTAGPRHEQTGKLAIYLKRDGQPDDENFDYRSREGWLTSLGVSEPVSGRWHLSVKASKNAEIADLVLEGLGFAVPTDSVTARYLRVVAESEASGGETASAAEIQLADSRSRPLDTASWRIHSVSSAEEGAKGAATNAIDGDSKTFWSTVKGVGYPHEMVIDLGNDSRFSQLRYLPRQDSGEVGNIRDYKVYASDNPYDGWTLVADGAFSPDNQVKVELLKPVESVLPPVAEITGKTEAEAGETVVLDASASSDPNGAALSFAWEASPEVAFDMEGAQLQFVAPSLAQDTPVRFTLTLDNGKQQVSKDHIVLVKAAVGASCVPEWSAQKAYVGGDKVQRKGRQYFARWWTQGDEPGNPSFTGDEGSGKVWRDEGPCQAGEVQPPQVEISGKTDVAAGERVMLDASASSDPNGLELSYHWQVSPALAFDAKGPQLSFVAPTAAQDSRYTFSLTLDNGQLTSTREHVVRVAADPSGSACELEWNRQQAYVGGNKVHWKGRTYEARWWTQGNEPGDPAFTGEEGSGKVWRDAGSCR